MLKALRTRRSPSLYNFMFELMHRSRHSVSLPLVGRVGVGVGEPVPPLVAWWLRTPHPDLPVKGRE